MARHCLKSSATPKMPSEEVLALATELHNEYPHLATVNQGVQIAWRTNSLEFIFPQRRQSSQCNAHQRDLALSDRADDVQVADRHKHARVATAGEASGESPGAASSFKAAREVGAIAQVRFHDRLKFTAHRNAPTQIRAGLHGRFLPCHQRHGTRAGVAGVLCTGIESQAPLCAHNKTIPFWGIPALQHTHSFFLVSDFSPSLAGTLLSSFAARIAVPARTCARASHAPTTDDRRPTTHGAMCGPPAWLTGGLQIGPL